MEDGPDRKRRSAAPSPTSSPAPLQLEDSSDCLSVEAGTSPTSILSSSDGTIQGDPIVSEPVEPLLLTHRPSQITAPELSKAAQREEPEPQNESQVTPSPDTMSGYIARVRYENPLPPPEFPPKLLEIPGTGLVSKYLSPAYANQMWRDQEMNIEADAELGMPLDLVGMPGIFDGDESSIQAPDHPPAVDPRDKPILRKVNQLGKPTSAASSVSFLRRTEYISADAHRNRAEASNASRQGKPASAEKKRRASGMGMSLEDPINILKTIVKGFDIAYPDEAYTGPDTAENVQGHKPTPEEVDAWNNPVHPTKKNLKVLDSYPVLPDLDAFPDSGGYMVMKFATNPLATSDSYDPRLDVGVLRPLELQPDVQESHKAAVAAHQADPNKPAPGPPPFDYEFSIPSDSATVQNIKRAFDVRDPEKDSPDLYDSVNKETGEKAFRYSRVRAYETGTTTGSYSQKFGEVALALHDSKPDAEDRDAEPDVSSSAGQKKQKGAYYYPLLQKSQIRPRRSVAQLMALSGGRHPDENADENRVDYLDISVRDADEEEASRRAEHRSEYDISLAADDEEDAEGEEDGEMGGGVALPEDMKEDGAAKIEEDDDENESKPIIDSVESPQA